MHWCAGVNSAHTQTHIVIFPACVCGVCAVCASMSVSCGKRVLRLLFVSLIHCSTDNTRVIAISFSSSSVCFPVEVCFPRQINKYNICGKLMRVFSVERKISSHQTRKKLSIFIFFYANIQPDELQGFNSNLLN